MGNFAVDIKRPSASHEKRKKTVFAQIMSLFNEYEFKKCVDRYNVDRHSIKFNCRDLFMVMSFAQFTDKPV